MFVGQAIDRQDGRLKVTGGAHYAAEFQLSGMAHAVLVQSTIAAGRAIAFDIRRAEAMPGVIAIITQQNAPRLDQHPGAKQSIDHPLLQDGRIVYNGQHVAVVIADTLDRATAAAAAVMVRYAPADAVTVMDEATLARGYTPKHFRGGQRSPDSSRGAPETAFDAAPVRIEATYETPVEHHNPMEPHATVAAWSGPSLTVWTATQGITGAQKTLSAAFGLQPEQVTVICPYVGGGFGSKGNTWPPAIIAALAARHVRRPVKLVLTRSQMFTSNGYRPATIQKLKLGATHDGKLLALRHDGFTQMCDPSLGEYSEPVALASEMLYACDNVGVSHRLVAVNQGLPTYMRAPGEAAGVYALECAMDELAAALRMDPVALRLKNYANADPHSGKRFASKALAACYEQAQTAFGWSRRNPEPGSMRDGRVRIGWGMATSTYPTNRSPASARLVIHADNTVIVQCGTQDLGTGTYTIMSQVAADGLGVPLSSVRAELGDSRLPSAPVSGGSQTAASVVPAVMAAVRAAKQQIPALAANDRRFAGVAASDIRLEGLVVVGPQQRVPLTQLLARLGSDHVVCEGSSEMQHSDDSSRHAFGAQFVEVRVDPDFGTIRVSRVVSAFDVGRLLNAKTGRSQLLGGIIFGIGMALTEETLIDRATGRIVNANIADYMVPVNADVPDIEVIAINAPDDLTGALGAKGIGELPMVGVAPAIANAVWHATGKRIRKLPIRIEDVLA